MSGIVESFVRNIVFPLQAKREKSGIPRLLAEFEKSQFLSIVEIRELQLERLKILLKHAYDNCPFYTARFDKARFNPSNVQSLDDIRRIPLLTKNDIQNNKETMRARNLSDDMIVSDKTGGSTGRPLNFYLDRKRVFSRAAAAFRHDRWTGWDIGQKSAYLWGHRGDLAEPKSISSKFRNLLLDRMIVLDTSSITSGKLAEFKVELKEFKPMIYVAYANSIYLFARYLKETGSIDHHHPNAIITSAELLESEQRQLIESVFECEVYDRYGSRETSIIASECPSHSGLHICAEALYIEFIKDGKQVGTEQLGKVIITDLLNFGMPFIRYQIEDVGMPVEKACSCGRGLPLMKIAGGRMTDFLVAPDGRIISGASLTIYLIANAPGVAQAQILQEKRNEIILRIVRNEKFGDESLRFFEREIPRFFGGAMKYELEYVDEIPLEQSGKYRFSISKIDPAEMF